MSSSDPIVVRLIELHKNVESAAKAGGSMVKGWRPLRFSSKGWIVADKIVEGEYQTNEFEPIGEWKKAAEYLALENELRRLLFSGLTRDQMDAYRTGIGLPVKGRLGRRTKKNQ